MALLHLARVGNRFALQGGRSVAVALTRSFGSSPVSKAAEAARQSHEERGWGSTTIADLLKSKGPDSGAWLWCSKDDLVIDAVRKMTKGNVGSLLVFDPSELKLDEKKTSEKAVVGIFTERDYLTKMVVQGKSSLSTCVSEVMTASKKLVTAEPENSVVDVMELMVENNIRHVPVVDEGHMVGMVSMRDVVNVAVKEHREEVGQLQEYIQGSY